MHWQYSETEEERAKRLAAGKAFWDRPADQVMGDFTIPEEDLPPQCRGGYCRQFRSPNIIDLVKVRRQRMKRKGG